MGLDLIVLDLNLVERPDYILHAHLPPVLFRIVKLNARFRIQAARIQIENSKPR